MGIDFPWGFSWGIVLYLYKSFFCSVCKEVIVIYRVLKVLYLPEKLSKSCSLSIFIYLLRYFRLITDCPHDGESVSRAFRQKFPHNLLRNGKEAMLAELLATSIKECHRKLRGNHWMRVDKLIGGSDAPTTLVLNSLLKY